MPQAEQRGHFCFHFPVDFDEVEQAVEGELGADYQSDFHRCYQCHLSN